MSDQTQAAPKPKPPRACEIIECNWRDEDSAGAPLLTRQGAPYWITNIQIADRPGVWIHGIVFKEPSDWKGTTRKLRLSVETYEGSERPTFKYFPEKKKTSSDRSVELLELILVELQTQTRLMIERA